MTEKANIAELANELIYRRYLIHHGRLPQHCKELNLPEYIAMHLIAEETSAEEADSEKLYLEALSNKMQLSIRPVSKIAGELRDRGLVTWSHDGSGSDGTYVTVTETGLRLIREQEQALEDYYTRVIKAYGRDNMVQLLHMMKQLEDVMQNELEGTEVSADASQAEL